MDTVDSSANITSKWKPSKAFLHTLVFLVLLLIVCCLSQIQGFILKNLIPTEYGLVKGKSGDLEMTYKDLLFFATVVFAFFVLACSLRLKKHKGLKITLASLSLFYLAIVALFIIIDLVYYIIFAYRLTFSSVQTILNTNSSEMGDFFRKYVNTSTVIAFTVFSFVCFMIIRKHQWFANLFSTPTFFHTTLVISILGGLDFYQFAHSRGNGLHNVRYWDITIGEYNEYGAFNRRIAAEKNDLNLSKEYDHFYKKDTIAKTLVLVISESLNKGHMSLYGYPRNTTPYLNNNKDIFSFKNCVTPAVLTVEAVPKLFFNGYLEKKINLIALLNKLGYETSWISNQSGWGKTDGPIVLLSEVCKRSFFTDSLADDDKANASIHYDEAVLRTLDKVLNTPTKRSRFVVVHLMGCHFDYEKRYPVGRGIFNTKAPAKTAVNNERVQKEINLYDNAVLYQDSVVNEVLKIFNKHSTSNNSALVFVADHGEELYEYRDHSGHSYPPNKSTAEIPFFASFSPQFLKTYPAIGPVAKKRTHTAYSTENNFFTLLHLLNINSVKYGKPIATSGFFSEKYDSTSVRLIMGCDYAQMLQ